ncbi:hypothetical protein ILUMI_15120 [Ignelater luminosus]|uniref:Uncharacterized protein n=1 Tax=Ignelater luminosus TaxID=2038154 RepID=A0A8K0CP69_IGNLU|nr:hypothetical protein ILUMI_15120 [Ignelater luminosus]
MEILNLLDNVELSEFEASDIEEEKNAMNLSIEIEETEANLENGIENYQLEEDAICEQYVGYVTPTILKTLLTKAIFT